MYQTVTLVIVLFLATWQHENQDLINNLGHKTYKIRETSTIKLFKASESPLADLLEQPLNRATSSSNQETVQRAYYLLKNVQQTKAKIWLKRYAQVKLPWIDMLPPDHPGRDYVISYYLIRAQERIGRDSSPTWEDYRLATKLYVTETINYEPSEQVADLLNQMIKQEYQWIANRGSAYRPPVKIQIHHKKFAP